MGDRISVRLARASAALAGVVFVATASGLAGGTEAGRQDRGLTAAGATATSTPKGKDYALLFATDEYADPAWRRLRNPINDATTIAAELKDSYGFAEARFLQNPTLSQITDTLHEYLTARQFGDNDQLFVFFAGHGLYRAPLDLGYIVASDSKAPDADRTNRSYLSFADLYRYINLIRGKHVFLVLDVCHGGTFAEAMVMRGETPRNDYDEATDAERISRILRRTTRKFLTSGGNEYVPDGSGAHSPFAAKFIEALRRPGSDRIITASEIYQVVRNVRPNIPEFGDFGKYEPVSDFVFVGKAIPAAPLAPAASAPAPRNVKPGAAVKLAYVDTQRLAATGTSRLSEALNQVDVQLVLNASESGIIWADTRGDLTSFVEARLRGEASQTPAVDALPGIRAGVVDLQRLVSESVLGRQFDRQVKAAPSAEQTAVGASLTNEFEKALKPILTRRASVDALDVILDARPSGVVWMHPVADLTAAVIRELDAGSPSSTAPAAVGQPASKQLAYIDLQRVANESVLGRDFTAQVAALTATKQKEIAAAARAPDLAARTEAAQRELTALQSRLQLEFQAALGALLEGLAKANGTRVLLSSADAGLVWANPALDLTAQTISAIDKATASRPRR